MYHVMGMSSYFRNNLQFSCWNQNIPLTKSFQHYANTLQTFSIWLLLTKTWNKPLMLFVVAFILYWFLFYIHSKLTLIRIEVISLISIKSKRILINVKKNRHPFSKAHIVVHKYQETHIKNMVFYPHLHYTLMGLQLTN